MYSVVVRPQRNVFVSEWIYLPEAYKSQIFEEMERQGNVTNLRPLTTNFVSKILNLLCKLLKRVCGRAKGNKSKITCSGFSLNLKSDTNFETNF